jgi:hypothetical protein
MELTPFFFALYKLLKCALYPLNWVLLVMTITTLWIWLPYTPQRLRWARIGCVSGLVLLLAISSPLVARPLLGSLEAWYQRPPLSNGEHFDAIVVLAGGLLQPARCARRQTCLPIQGTERPVGSTFISKAWRQSWSSAAAVVIRSEKA